MAGIENNFGRWGVLAGACCFQGGLIGLFSIGIVAGLIGQAGIGFGATKSAKNTKITGQPLAASEGMITTKGTKTTKKRRNREGILTAENA